MLPCRILLSIEPCFLFFYRYIKFRYLLLLLLLLLLLPPPPSSDGSGGGRNWSASGRRDHKPHDQRSRFGDLVLEGVDGEVSRRPGPGFQEAALVYNVIV